MSFKEAMKEDLNSAMKGALKNARLFSFILGLICGIAILALGIWGYPQVYPYIENYLNLESKRSPGTQDEEVPIREYALNKEVSVYLVWWDQENGFDTLKKNANSIESVHPFWYQMKADGSIDKFSGAEDEEITDYCKDNEIKIIPVISNEHEAIPVQRVFADKDVRDEHIDNIVGLVTANDYDGIEIDYESLESSDRADLSEFISLLAAKIHKQGKLLTAAVHAKTTDQGTWGGPASQDWAEYNKAVDRVKIMTYDYHWSTSEAGNIAPISWMSDVLDYAATVFDKEKVHVGIHFYGYDWVDKNAESLTYEDVQELITTYGVISTKMTNEKEKYFDYEKSEEEHTVYFADNQTIKDRISLANEYQISGIGIWRIGQEDPENWTTIKEVFKK